jgi:ubiquinone/menaquinone biosynthesis C-methylase UbiE
MSGEVGRMGCASLTRPADDIEIRHLGARHFQGKDVLDIGTGTGRLARLIAPIAHAVVGIDPDADAIREARREARASGLRNVRFGVGPAQDLGVRRSRFDTALFSWSL